MEKTGRKISVVVSLGSNSGDRHRSVKEAIRWLGEVLTDVHSSDIYETQPVGHVGNLYMNAVVAGNCCCEVASLEKMCKDYEVAHGRDEVARSHNLVPIDLDIVMAGGRVLRERDFRCSFFRKGYLEVMAFDTV